MKNLKVSVKLFVSFALLVLLAVIIAAVGYFGMDSINKADDTLYNENLVAISIMGEIRENTQKIRVGLRNFVLYSGNDELLNSTLATMNSVLDTLNGLFVEYEKTITDASIEQDYFDGKALLLGECNSYINQAYNLALTSAEEAEALVFSTEVSNCTDSIINSFTTSMNNNETWAKQSCDDNTALFLRMVMIMGGVLLVSIAISAFLAFYISNIISKPLQSLTTYMEKAATTGDIELSEADRKVIENFSNYKDETGQCINSTSKFLVHISNISRELGRVAEGDLSHEVTTLSDRDVMGVAVQKMLANLNHMFKEIFNSTEQVSAGSKQIADGAQALAQGSTEQAASVEELSSSISEVADKTKVNAEMAIKAANLGDSIKVNAQKGSEQMDQMVQAVKEISDASQSIGKVIKVIDDIAFQTNILALNAAVEAARAGQHGKGFAVVAEEVRNLAAKSAEAAKDTGSLIANSMEKAELGEGIARDTAESLADIVSGINESGIIVGDIAQSSEEQAAAITQINLGIEQVAQVVQQNSATAEESAAASQQMSGQANILGDLLAQFKLKN